MADKQARVLVTCNAGDAKKILEDFDRLIEQHTAHIKELVAAGQANSAECKKEERLLRALSQVQRDNIEDTKRLGAVVDDLANTKLRDLRRALGSGKSALQGLTGSPEDIARAEKIREQMRQVGNQLKLLEGQYVKVEEGMKDLDHQSDQWLDKAIKQQQELVGVTRRGTAEYDKMKASLDKLTNERDVRSMRAANEKRDKDRSWAQQDAKSRMGNIYGQSESELKNMLKTFEQMKSEMAPYSQEWQNVAKNIETVNARMKEVQANAPYAHNYDNAKSIASSDTLDLSNGAKYDVTKKDLEWSKNYLQNELGNTPLTDTAKIKEIQEALGVIDNRMKALNGDTQTAAMSSEKLNDVLNNMKTASLDELKEASKELNKQLGKLAPSSEAAKQVKQQLAALDKEIKQVEEDVVDVNDVIARSKSGRASIDELKKAYKQLGDEVGKLETGSEEFKSKQKELKKLKQEIDDVTGAARNQSSAWQTAMKNLTAYVGMFTLFNKAKEMMMGVLKNFEFSSSLTDIRKVSGMAMEDVNELATELAKIDTRTSIDGLAQLAYAGAKLGMGKYGVEGMAGFVRAADKINVAIGEEMGKEALPALSKLVEVMGLIPKMGIEKAMDATGSAMFKLSSTSTATSGNIVEFAKRLTGVARTAGITTDQLLALGSASDSMYLMPEVASTAMSKFIVALQRNHNLIEKDLGIQQGTIKNMYAAGNAMDAIVLVLEKMKQTGNMNALGGIFKDLGSDGQRLVTAMVTMSKNVDMLKDHLYESQEAFEEATAVTNEYVMQNQSAAGILERANNLWEKAFVNPDGVNNVKDLAEVWYSLSQTILQSPLYNGTMHAAFTAVTTSAKLFVALLPLLINYLVSAGIAKGISFMWQLTKAIRAAFVAQTALNSAVKVNPYVVLASVILTAVGVVWSYVNAAKNAAEAEAEAERKANAWKSRLGEAQRETDTMIKKLHSYKTAMEKLNLSQTDRMKQISQFNRDFRSYINKLGIEIKSVDDLKKHYAALSEEIQQATYYRLREQAKQDAMPALQKDRLTAENKLKTELQKMPSHGGGFTAKGIMNLFAKGANAEWIYRKIIEAQTTSADRGIDFEGTTGKYSFTNSRGVHWESSGNQSLLSALRYYQNATRREANKEKEIDEHFGDFVKKDYHPWVDDELGTLDNEAKDKETIAKEKRDKQEQKRAWREELKQAQDEAKAIMSNLSNYYERQINEQTARLIADGASQSEIDLRLQPLRDKKDAAESQARRAISGKDNTWTATKGTLRGDILEKTDPDTGVNLSEGLLNDILGVDIEALRKKILGLEKALKMAYNSSTAEIFANSTGNESAILARRKKQMEARRKVAQENDYMGVVKQNMYDDFNTMGFANPTKDELSDKKAFDKRKENIFAMYEKARNELSQLYSIDVSTGDGQGLLIKFLFGEDADGMGARIKSTLGESAADWQAFYAKLVQYSDQYTEAQKKTYDQQKKITDQMWAVNQRNLRSQRELSDMQSDASLFGTQKNFFSTLGLANNTVDPEVETMRLKMQMAEDYYYFVLQNTKNEQLIAEAEKSRQEAELAYAAQMATAMKSRLSQMQSLVSPIVDFGEAMGEAFAKMGEDAESANEAIKSAVKSMLQTWGKMLVNDVNTQMWQAINNAGVQRGKKDAQPGIDAARANGKAGATADAVARTASTLGESEDNPMYVHVVNGQPVDANGNPVAAPMSPTGDVVRDPDGTQGVAPTVNQTAGGSFTDEYLGSQENNGSVVFKDNGKSDSSNGKQESSGAPKKNDSTANAAKAVAGNVNGGELGASAADAMSGGSSWGDFGVRSLGAGLNTLLTTPIIKTGGSDGKANDKSDKKAVKDAKKQQDKLTDITKKGTKERTGLEQSGTAEITEAYQQGSDDRSGIIEVGQDTIVAATEAGLTATLTATQANETSQTALAATGATTRTSLSLVEAVAKCFAFLGPIAGPVAAATVTSILMGLLAWGLSAAFGSGSDSSSSTSTPKTKLKTGMLTYDSGNVQDLKPFVADNGDIYWAKEDEAPASGVNLLSTPTATTINGRPSLVAENGPELVIGRETTKAMMMNNPSLLRALVNYDSNYSGRSTARRAYDEGNVSEVALANSAQLTGASFAQSAASDATNAALLQALSALMTRLEQPLYINMFGRGGLYENVNKANQFMKGK